MKTILDRRLAWEKARDELRGTLLVAADALERIGRQKGLQPIDDETSLSLAVYLRLAACDVTMAQTNLMMTLLRDLGKLELLSNAGETDLALETRNAIVKAAGCLAEWRLWGGMEAV